MIISDIFIFAKKTSDIILKYLSIAIGWLLGLFHTHTHLPTDSPSLAQLRVTLFKLLYFPYRNVNESWKSRPKAGSAPVTRSDRFKSTLRQKSDPAISGKTATPATRWEISRAVGGAGRRPGNRGASSHA